MTPVTITGGGQVGSALARRLNGEYEVSFVDDDPQAVARAEDAGVAASDGDATEVPVLQTAGIEPETTVVVAGDCDSENLLVAQLVRTKFGVRDVVVLMNDTRNGVAFADREIGLVSAADVLADALVHAVRNRQPTDWLTVIDDGDRNVRRKVK